jgi:hypothetical protein
MVFSPLVKRQVPFLHVPGGGFQIKNGLAFRDRFLGHWCQNATPNSAPSPAATQGELTLCKYG